MNEISTKISKYAIQKSEEGLFIANERVAIMIYIAERYWKGNIYTLYGYNRWMCIKADLDKKTVESLFLPESEISKKTILKIISNINMDRQIAVYFCMLYGIFPCYKDVAEIIREKETLDRVA